MEQNKNRISTFLRAKKSVQGHQPAASTTTTTTTSNTSESENKPNENTEAQNSVGNLQKSETLSDDCDFLEQFRNDLKAEFEKAGKIWAKKFDKIWAFGPNRMGPNILLNSIPDYSNTDYWKSAVRYYLGSLLLLSVCIGFFTGSTRMHAG